MFVPFPQNETSEGKEPSVNVYSIGESASEVVELVLFTCFANG
jgi:hypothetical protein